MSINNLPTVSAVASGDAVALFSAALGGDAKATLPTFIAYVQAQLQATGGFVSLYSTPATGFTYTVTPPVAGENCFVLLTPAGTLATGAINLPTAPVHGQEVLVHSTQTITALTLSGGTYGVSGAPTTMGAATPWKVRFDGVLNAWYRIV
jgi:hypothetical protein